MPYHIGNPSACCHRTRWTQEGVPGRVDGARCVHGVQLLPVFLHLDSIFSTAWRRVGLSLDGPEYLSVYMCVFQEWLIRIQIIPRPQSHEWHILHDISEHADNGQLNVFVCSTAGGLHLARERNPVVWLRGLLFCYGQFYDHSAAWPTRGVCLTGDVPGVYRCRFGDNSALSPAHPYEWM